MNGTRGCAGCFGKVRSYGDFVTRNLPPGFVARWDAMLQAGMLASRAAHGDDWLTLYLRAPLWYFVLGADVVDENVWAGVLMPSVDSVGRHFPLTIAAAPGRDQGDGSEVHYAWLIDARSWFERCGELALATLGATATLPELEQGLLTPGSVTPDGEAHHGAWPIDSCTRGASLWWTDGSDTIAPSVRRCPGLPGALQLSGLFDGDMAGWS